MPREMKTHDTADPITGVARSTDPATGDLVRVDLTVFDSIEFQFRLPAADAVDVIGGPAVDVETVDGAGTPGLLFAIDGLPENRGRFRYEQVDADVDTSGIYNTELECVLGTKKVHFPSKEAENDTLTLGHDLDDN